MVIGLDCSTTCAGWAFCSESSVLDAGFIDISKKESNKDKSFLIINSLNNNSLIKSINKINLEASLSGFGYGRTSQQTIIKLSRFNAIFEYILSEHYKLNINLINASTARKKVFGKASIKGIKPKEYVKRMLPEFVPNLAKFEKLNTKNNWDVKNGDMYDAIVMGLYG